MPQVALKFVIDDFAIHVIEECLLQKLPEIFTPSVVIALEDSIVESIAAESEDSKVERISCAGKLEILEKALSILRRLDRHNPRDHKLVKREIAEEGFEREETGVEN